MFFFHDGTGILPAQQLRRHRQSVEPDDAHAISPQTLQPGAADRSARLARAEWPVRSLTGIPPYRPGPPERPDGDAAAGADVPGSWAGSWTADDGDPSVGEPFREISDGMAITPSVSVVLPVMNEAANLPHVFASLPAWIDEVVLVDGRSTDDTIAVARQLRPDVKIVLQGGVGKGDALVAGFEACTGDIIVTIDGDGSTDGQEIVRFVGTLMTGADFAKGSRFSSAGRSDDITAIRRYGNKMLNIAVNKMFGTSFSDLCYGYNAFWARHLDRLGLDCPGFEVETLMSIRAARAGLRIHEVPSHERPRLHGSTNLSAVRDGLRILRLIVREKQEIARRAARKPRPFMAPARLAEDQVGGPQLGSDARANGRNPSGNAAPGPAAIGRTALGRTALGSTALGSTALGSTALGSTALGRTALGHIARDGLGSDFGRPSSARVAGQ